jgi:hypothetical protein
MRTWSKNGAAVAVLFGLMWVVVSAAARADVKDYEFQLVQSEIKKGDGAIVAVRLVTVLAARKLARGQTCHLLICGQAAIHHEERSFGVGAIDSPTSLSARRRLAGGSGNLPEGAQVHRDQRRSGGAGRARQEIAPARAPLGAAPRILRRTVARSPRVKGRGCNIAGWHSPRP